MTRTSSPSQSKPQKIILIVLGLALLGTVFLLPQFVTEPWFVNDAVEQEIVPTPSAETVAPSTAAELKRYRQESQTVLAEIVMMRDRLRERSVALWGEADFQHALGRVESGDEEYSYGNYEASLRDYREAREQLAQLEELGRQKLEQAKAEGVAAVEALNPNVAVPVQELASAMAPEDPAVQELAARVVTLEDVARHIEAGDDALIRDRYDAARSEFEQALALDSRHQRAADGLAQARNEITGSAFRRQMSEGFAGLERGEYETARAAFGRAGEIQPGNPAVSQALAQVDNRESQGFVNVELARAADLESNEQWAEALSIYGTLLEEDPSLADARARLIPARVRAGLDEQLSGYIEEPLRLSNKAEYQKAQTTLADAKGIANSGPRLRQQIGELETLLERATSPVNVTFRSDNQTHVVLYRVAELGRFEQTSMTLRPGRYVAAGTRTGYRDVRVEFTITGEPLNQPIEVRCEEPIG